MSDACSSNHISLLQTALHFCCSKNNLPLARRLIEQKATARVKDKRGQLPLHRAAAIGSVPLVQLMLDNKSPVNATDDVGQTALHHGMHTLLLLVGCCFFFADCAAAIAEGNGDVAIALLKAGAVTDKEDIDGHTALSLAPDQKVCRPNVMLVHLMTNSHPGSRLYRSCRIS